MDKMIRPVFTFDINFKIIPGLVIIGKYDGTHPCITAATTSDKVVIHSPYRKNTNLPGRIVWSEFNREIATLNINQKITALSSGVLDPEDEKDVLVIGTATHILAYHVHDNKDIFYKECPDGVKAITIGSFKNGQLVMVGGNSSVHGYDHKGNEMFWTAVGDSITSLILMDYNKDNSNELIVSSEDFNIRVFKSDLAIAEYTETEVVTGLTALPDNKFAYSVSNGTVGVYQQELRLWRVKSKHFAISIWHYDLLGQGSSQLITGWSNGKMDCRSSNTGEVLFKDTMKSSVAGVVEGDYRSVGKSDLICVSVEGEVRGYTTSKSLAGPSSGLEQDTVRELLSKKQSLLLELKQYDNNTKYNEAALAQTDSYEDIGVIPANTRLQISITAGEDKFKNCIEIYASTNNSTVIKVVAIFAEGIFKGETHIVHPAQSKLRSDLLIPLTIPKDHPVDIHIKAFVGYPNSIQFHVFEVTRQLPRFSMYNLETKPQKQPESYAEFKMNERLNRICMWINQNFLLSNDIECENEHELQVHFRCLRDDSRLTMEFEVGKAVFFTENITLAVDLIQSLATFLNLDTLSSKAHFPKEEALFRKNVEKLNAIDEARLRLGADIADRLGQIRTLVLKAEDSRLNDIKEMPKYYNELNILNQELINNYNIRLRNYEEGLETMKSINSLIHKASRLRVGINSSKLIAQCRNAIKSNNTEGLIQILRNGEL